ATGTASASTLCVHATRPPPRSALLPYTTLFRSVTVSAVTPNQGTMGTTVAVTIDGSGFVSGARVSAGAGITVSYVVWVSSTRLTAAAAMAAGHMSGRPVGLVMPAGRGGGALTHR